MTGAAGARTGAGAERARATPDAQVWHSQIWQISCGDTLSMMVSRVDTTVVKKLPVFLSGRIFLITQELKK
jgi:hypothetical protein